MILSHGKHKRKYSQDHRDLHYTLWPNLSLNVDKSFNLKALIIHILKLSLRILSLRFSNLSCNSKILICFLLPYLEILVIDRTPIILPQ